MSVHTRRSLLALSGITAVTGTIVFLTRGHSHDGPRAVVASPNPEDPGLRARALTDERALAGRAKEAAGRISATKGPDATAKALLLAVMAHHNDHVTFLRGQSSALPRPTSFAVLPAADPILSPQPSPTPSATASPSLTPSPTPTETPTPTPTHTPTKKPTKSPSPSPSHTVPPPPKPPPSIKLSPSVRSALDTLARAERTAMARRNADLTHCGPELAQVLASIAASGAVSIDLLGDVPSESVV